MKRKYLLIFAIEVLIQLVIFAVVAFIKDSLFIESELKIIKMILLCLGQVCLYLVLKIVGHFKKQYHFFMPLSLFCLGYILIHTGGLTYWMSIWFDVFSKGLGLNFSTTIIETFCWFILDGIFIYWYSVADNIIKVKKRNKKVRMLNQEGTPKEIKQKNRAFFYQEIKKYVVLGLSLYLGHMFLFGLVIFTSLFKIIPMFFLVLAFFVLVIIYIVMKDLAKKDPHFEFETSLGSLLSVCYISWVPIIALNNLIVKLYLITSFPFALGGIKVPFINRRLDVTLLQSVLFFIGYVLFMVVFYFYDNRDSSKRALEMKKKVKVKRKRRVKRKVKPEELAIKK